MEPKFKKKRRSNPKQAGDVLQALLEKRNSPLSDQFQRYRLKMKWPEVVGPTFSQVCHPCGYHKGKLYVCAKNSSWMNQLFYARKEILKKVNSYLGLSWVTEVRLTLDARDVPAEAIPKEDPQALTECASPNEDGALPRGR